MNKASDNIIVFEKINKYFFFQHQKTLKEFFQAFLNKQKTLERVHALKDLNFTVKKGETLGVIGKNGAGKSTLLKLIAGVSFPTSGKMKIDGKVAPLIELGAGFHPELTGEENIYLNGVILGLKESFIKDKFDEIVHFAEIKDFIDVPIKYYSSGMYMRLAFSTAIFTSPEILLIDEIFAVGDIDFQKKCIDKMNEFKKNGVTIILVSHDLITLKEFSDRTIYLQDGKITFDGATDKAINIYQENNVHY